MILPRFFGHSVKPLFHHIQVFLRSRIKLNLWQKAIWCIENTCNYVIDWNFNEDSSRIRTGYDIENISRIRRFAVGILKQKKSYSIAQKMRRLNKNMRAVFIHRIITPRMQKDRPSFNHLFKYCIF